MSAIERQTGTVWRPVQSRRRVEDENKEEGQKVTGICLESDADPASGRNHANESLLALLPWH